jgi:hypothetical protein
VRRLLETYWIGDDRSLVYVTNWTFVHFLSGVVLTSLFPAMTYWTAFLIHSAAELWQIIISNTPWWTLRGWIDIGMDTLFFMSGVWVAKTRYLR